MKIPNFAGDIQFVDENGMLTEEWSHILSQLFNELQTQMSDEGHIAPSQSTTDIAQLNVTKYSGGLVYDSDVNKLKVNVNGTFKEVVTA